MLKAFEQGNALKRLHEERKAATRGRGNWRGRGRGGGRSRSSKSRAARGGRRAVAEPVHSDEASTDSDSGLGFDAFRNGSSPAVSAVK